MQVQHEAAAIAAVKTPNTVTSLLRDFRSLGICKGDTLIVHSSMSQIGWVCGAARAVVDALQQAVDETGLLVMPAHSSDNSDPSEWECPPVDESWWPIIRANMPPFDPRRTPTRGMGRIAECFRACPEVYRSSHPQVSWAAWGKGAEDLVREHPLTPQFGMKSPLGKLYTCNAKVLLLGVGYEHCTCMHLAETLMQERPMKSMGASVLEDGKPKWATFEDVDLDSDRFPLIGAAYEQHIGDSRLGRVGNAECRVLHVKPLINFARLWIQENFALSRETVPKTL